MQRPVRATLAATAAGVLALTLMPALGLGSASAAPPQATFEGLSPFAEGEDGANAGELAGQGFQGEGQARIHDLDARRGSIAPTQAARDAVGDLGARVTWNPFGTPASLSPVGKLTLTSNSNLRGVAAAEAFVSDQQALFGLDAAEVAALDVIQDTPLYDAPDLSRLREGQAPANTDVAHIVLFRQNYGDVVAAQSGLITVGVTNAGAVAYVSSSVTPSTGIINAQQLDSKEALVLAGTNVGQDFTAGALTQVGETAEGDFATFQREGVSDLQYARLRGLGTPDGVRLVWETTTLNNRPADGEPVAFVHMIDAQNGDVLIRENRVQHFANLSGGAKFAPASGSFTGSTGEMANGGGAGPDHDFDVPAGNGSIAVGISGPPPTADLVLELFFETVPDVGPRTLVASQDTVGNPEALVYSPTGGVPPGRYVVVVRPFDTSGDNIRYDGVFQPAQGAAVNPTARPRWENFPSNPQLPANDDGTLKPGSAPDDRETWCWDGTRGENGCDRVVGFRAGPGVGGPGGGPNDEGNNVASRLPWDVNPRTLQSTRTTEGNNADTAPSFASFLTPDAGAGTSPVALDRNYAFPFADAWNTAKCNEANFTPASATRNDIDAATTNLFVGHNRMHDWSYYLGYTEPNFNMQMSNFDNPATGGVVNQFNGGENDPEQGQSQAGAIGGGPTFQGRDNANQISLQDGIPGITNQYLWQPLQAGFYAPCVDGAFDFSVLGHEYGHAIQGRMVGGPDTGLSGAQAGSMNESWSDLNAAAYATEFGFAGDRGENPFAVGAYVTGANTKGIRNYGMNEERNLLNFSDIEYDGNGTTSPHADGEIWSAVNYDIRERLVDKYAAEFPGGDYSDGQVPSDALQTTLTRCATGVLPADECPGNRRWKQIVYDAYLLQQSNTSMLTARDAYLAADVLRFGGDNQQELAEEFAARGFGSDAATAGTADRNPIPSFGTGQPSDATASFVPVAVGAGGTPAAMEVFVGTYEARITPITTVTDGAGPSVKFTPGTYQFIARANGYGAFRFAQTFTAGQAATVQVPMRLNIASETNGAVAAGSDSSGQEGGGNIEELIDDTEETNAAFINEGDLRDDPKFITVDLAGEGPVNVNQVQVSAALRPARTSEDPAEDPDDEPYDTGGQSRFSALRQFEILTCNSVAGLDCRNPAVFTSVFTSAEDAFPGIRPRPTAPDLTLRPFDVTDSQATHVMIKVLDNQCTGGPLYAGEANPDNSLNPGQDPDCADGLAVGPATAGMTGGISLSQAERVRLTELQVFTEDAPNGGIEQPNPVIPEVPSTALLGVLGVAIAGYAVWRRREHATA